MKVRHAIGVTINGNEVRAAFLSLVRGKARIKALESVKLDAPLEHVQPQVKAKPESLNDLQNAFDINEPRVDPDEEPEDSSTKSNRNSNVSQVYALLEKFSNIKANLAINSPHLTVKYEFLKKEQAPGKRKKGFKERIDLWGGDNGEARRANHIDVADGQLLKVDYEYHPAIIDLMEEVNQFRSGNLNMVLMDTNELALVDLVKEIYKFDKEEITALVYIEQDFSRVIFLKGRDIYHITPIVHKGSMSNDVLDVIYSKMIFAQDQYFIPELNKILVAGHSSRLKAKYYFRQKFPSAVTGYLNSKKIQSDLRFKDRGLLFSRYAVPIALAWKALVKNAYKKKNQNLLPEYILERQTMPKLAIHGYVLLFLLAATTFSFTWALVTKRLEISSVRSRVETMQTQIDDNKSLTERVRSFDDKIMAMERKITLVDSFSIGYDGTMNIIKLLNESITEVGSIWIADLRLSKNTINITGYAKQRDRIPELATKLGGANLKKVTRSVIQGESLFLFSLDKEFEEAVATKPFDLMTFLKEVEENAEKEVHGDGLLANGGAPNSAKQVQTSSSGKPQAQQKLAAGNLMAANGHQTATAVSGQAPATNGHKQAYVYGLQIGSYESSSAASNEAKEFTKKGLDVKLSKPAPDKFALIVGAFSNYQDAQKLSDLLAQQESIDSTIIKYKAKRN